MRDDTKWGGAPTMLGDDIVWSARIHEGAESGRNDQTFKVETT